MGHTKTGVTAFVVPPDAKTIGISRQPPTTPSYTLVKEGSVSRLFAEATTKPQGFGGVTVEERPVQTTKSPLQTKELLLDLLPRMTGVDEEFRQVETYVNDLEKVYQPAQTLDFFNFAVTGEWQLLFSTNLSGGPKPNFRLLELFQKIEPRGLGGNVTNIALWALAEQEDSAFDCTGSFSVQCTYEISQGSRMATELEQHLLEPARGSKIPSDVPALVGMLHRSMPKELFDPSHHAMDTTYLDADLRIVRMTGSRFEGVRGIFIRRGSMVVDPTGQKETAEPLQ